MAGESIFHNLVKSENSYTRLLRNLMVRDTAFRTEFLSLFLREEQAKSISAKHVLSQKRLGDCGQPDLLIETGNLSLIIEVKTENLTGGTPKQLLRPSTCDRPETYLDYLQKKSSEKCHALLVFLVPHAWKYRPKFQDQITVLKATGAKNNVSVQLVSWAAALRHFETEGTASGDGFVKEFYDLAVEKFGTTGFVQEEIDSMKDDKMSLKTALKINSLISEVKTKAKKDGSGDWDIAKDALGFYLEANGKWLYFGCWLECKSKSGHGLCFGVEDPTERVKAAFIKSLRNEYGQSHFGVYEKWIMGSVPDGDLVSSDAVWSKLEKVWNAVKNA